jgi:hypothetical protein
MNPIIAVDVAVVARPAADAPPPPKKARISWIEEQKEEALNYVLLQRCSTSAEFGVAAGFLNATSKFFKDTPVSGANLMAKCKEWTLAFQGKYLADTANKSGFDGDKEANYLPKIVNC